MRTRACAGLDRPSVGHALIKSAVRTVLYAGIAASAAPASAFDFKISDTAWGLIDNDWYGSYAFGRADDKGFFGRGLTTGTFNYRLSNGTTIGASGSVEYFSNLRRHAALRSLLGREGSMDVRSVHTLPDLRLALLTGASAPALCLSAHAAHAQSITIEGEGDWVRPIGDDVVYAEYLNVIANTAVNQSIARGNDFGGRGQAIIQFNSWFSISGGGGRAMLENSGAAPHADLFLVNQTYLYPQIVTVPDFVTTGCPPNQQACEQIYQDGKATLRSEIDFYDFDVGADVGIGTKGKARFFAGVRYVKFDETLSTTFTNSQNTAYSATSTLQRASPSSTPAISIRRSSVPSRSSSKHSRTPAFRSRPLRPISVSRSA